MNPIRRELLNGLLVLVVASLLSVAFSAFQVSFNAQLWVLILIGIAMAVGGYVVFEFVLSAEKREVEGLRKSEQREQEWLKRVGTPARLDLSDAVRAAIDALKGAKPGSDLALLTYVGAGGGEEAASFRLATGDAREEMVTLIHERLSRGAIRECKLIFCFEREIIENNHELRSGILRVGQGPGTIDRLQGELCQRMLQIKGGSVFVAPVVFRAIIGLYGTQEASITFETAGSDSGGRRIDGVMVFHDPPNGEIIEQFRQIERETERRMVAVHKIVFPEDAVSTTEAASR